MNAIEMSRYFHERAQAKHNEGLALPFDSAERAALFCEYHALIAAANALLSADMILPTPAVRD